jgi:hypothetical protein
MQLGRSKGMLKCIREEFATIQDFAKCLADGLDLDPVSDQMGHHLHARGSKH